MVSPGSETAPCRVDLRNLRRELISGPARLKKTEEILHSAHLIDPESISARLARTHGN